ncbi:unnamed protein product [Arabis nemorensis]|uniref:Uncharacterized protein n=1 Tax=Arabis nemorensis TaxID=586526 RepID=A0A565APV9_9BRAS|nr:unnamed protein product [Arabis nemorensis]
MEGPLLSKSEHIVDTTLTNGDSSSDDEHIVHITADADSPSTYEQTPHEAKGVQWSVQWKDPCRFENVWNLIEFCLTLVQIAVARVVVTRAEAEHGEATLYPWIVGYTCLCIATLPILCWRFCHYNRCVSSVVCNTIDEVVDFLKWVFEYFFLGWVALFFLWFFIFNDSSSLDNTTQLFWCASY